MRCSAPRPLLLCDALKRSKLWALQVRFQESSFPQRLHEAKSNIWRYLLMSTSWAIFCIFARPMVSIFELIICWGSWGPSTVSSIFEFAAILRHRGCWLACVTWSDISCSWHISRAPPFTEIVWAFCLLRIKHALSTIDAWLFADGNFSPVKHQRNSYNFNSSMASTDRARPFLPFSGV